MALKALMLRKKIDDKRKLLESMRAKDEELQTREAELEKGIEEAESEEERAAVEEAVGSYENDKSEHENAKNDLEREIGELEKELQEVEKVNDTVERLDNEIETIETRTVKGNHIEKDINKMGSMERSAMFEREDVKGWISEIRAHVMEKRDLTNVGLTIPEVFLGFLKQNIENYSKLYKHVNVRSIGGTGREVIMGSVPEAVWTECCATLNELSLNFNDVEVDCFKVGGYFKVCNAILEDSDIQLASTLLDAIGQAIGLALDKAILYGNNTNTNSKMPLGVVSRLAQTAAPTGYPATARAWEDLHESNIIKISGDATGIALYQAIVSASGAMKGKYARGQKTWVMNEKTYTTLQVNAMSINASGAIVSGQNGTMPIIGGSIEILDFVPDNVIIGGYFELYLLAERAGAKFAQSEHAFFIQDQTVFKGTARYDGKPVIAEAFIAIGLNNTAVDPAEMTFAADTANAGA